MLPAHPPAVGSCDPGWPPHAPRCPQVWLPPIPFNHAGGGCHHRQAVRCLPLGRLCGWLQSRGLLPSRQRGRQLQHRRREGGREARQAGPRATDSPLCCSQRPPSRTAGSSQVLTLCLVGRLLAAQAHLLPGRPMAPWWLPSQLTCRSRLTSCWRRQAASTSSLQSAPWRPMRACCRTPRLTGRTAACA